MAQELLSENTTCLFTLTSKRGRQSLLDQKDVQEGEWRGTLESRPTEPEADWTNIQGSTQQIPEERSKVPLHTNLCQT